jgi:tRNA pseudouridine55 synthase
MTPGIHLLHKPVGPTSFSLVQACIQKAPPRDGRRALRICHGGTLDPFASGLLLILVEPATRLFSYLHAIPKVYEATVRWGIETDNGDPHGKTVFTGDASGLRQEQLDASLAGFVGWHDQIPPATSAKRIGGERAYVKAHRGETVSLPASSVYLHEASWLNHELPEQSRLRLVVRGGYYVRTLARDLGRLLGCGAHLSQLHRVAIGPWNDPGPDIELAAAGREILSWSATRVLGDQDVGELRHERPIPESALAPPTWPVPAGFPDPQAPIRGVHQERLRFLLARQAGQLKLVTALRGGL